MGVELVSNARAYHGSVDLLTKRTQQDNAQSANANAALRSIQNVNKNNVREVKPPENRDGGGTLSSSRDKMFKQGKNDNDGDNDAVGSKFDHTF